MREPSTIRERGIAFTAPMVLAILYGRKLQTRRLVELDEFGPSDTKGYDFSFRDRKKRWHDHTTATLLEKVAPVRIGDRLWVREAWRADRLFDDRPPRDVPEWSPTLMLADETHRGGHLGHPGRYRHARYMPRHFSRIDLRVRTVRVELLGDISDVDARAEGLKALTKDGGQTVKWGIPDRDGLPGTDDHGWPWCDWNADPRVAFATLWDRVHGEGAWERDRYRWVWVYGFEVESGAGGAT